MIWWVLLLSAAGVALLLAEFFVPGAVLGILGGTLIALSTALGMYFYPQHAILVLGVELLGTVLTVLGGLFLISKTNLGSGLKLSTRQNVSDGYSNVPTDSTLLGATGTVYTPLRPAGSIIIDGERMDAVANGTFIPAGTQVRVIEVHGIRVVVEALTPAGN